MTMHALTPLVGCLLAVAAHAQSFVNFETPQVHAIAVSQDGQRLLALNTPDNRLAVFSLARPSLPVRF